MDANASRQSGALTCPPSLVTLCLLFIILKLLFIIRFRHDLPWFKLTSAAVKLILTLMHTESQIHILHADIAAGAPLRQAI